MFQVKFGLISDRDQEDDEEDEEECYIIEDDDDLLMASFSRWSLFCLFHSYFVLELFIFLILQSLKPTLIFFIHN